MAFGMTITESANTSAQDITSTRTYSDSSLFSVSESCANSQTTEIVVAIDVSEITAICIMSDKNVTLKTNSADTPDETISLLANRPYKWVSDSYFANLLETDITSIFITNASGGAATVQLSAVIDSTP